MIYYFIIIYGYFHNILYKIVNFIHTVCVQTKKTHTHTLMSSVMVRQTAGINPPHWPWRWRCLHPWLLWCASASLSSPDLPGNQTWRGTAAHRLQPQHSCITGRKQPASMETQPNSISRPKYSSRLSSRNLRLVWEISGQNRLYGATPGDSCLDLVQFVTDRTKVQLICHQ